MEVESLITAPQVFANLLDEHPEIIQFSAAAYSHHPHGTGPGDLFQTYVPVSEKDFQFVDGRWNISWTSSDEIVAIGSAVTFCPEVSCDHSPRSHFDNQNWLWHLWHEDCVRSPQGLERSFVFLDIEMYQPENLKRIIMVLDDIPDNYYVLDSGKGFHVIFDRLVPLEELATEYGKIVTLFGDKLGSERLSGWGRDLKKGGNSPREVLSWCDLVLENCGHVDESTGEDREVHFVDLRHIAHSLQGVIRYSEWMARNSFCTNLGWLSDYPPEIGGSYLRISPKHKGQLPPVLVAQKNAGIVKYFDQNTDPFGSQSQPRLL